MHCFLKRDVHMSNSVITLCSESNTSSLTEHSCNYPSSHKVDSSKSSFNRQEIKEPESDVLGTNSTALQEMAKKEVKEQIRKSAM